jgi:CRP/FNR family cyclic AMP-dependent transcriptional regulator
METADVEYPSVAQDLAHLRFFADLPSETLARIAEWGERVTFDEGSEILTEGQPANSFYAIQHGRVAVGVHAPSEGFVVIETLQRGDVLGWSWLLPPYRVNFDAVALRPVRAIQIHARNLRPYLDENPRSAVALVTGIAGVMEDRLQSARMRLINLYGDPHDENR